MSLFGDLPSAKNEPVATTGHASAYAKRAFMPPPSILRNKRKKTDSKNDTESIAGGRGGTDSALAARGCGLFSMWSIEEEYDPAVPNEYEKAKQAQEQAVLEAEMDARKAAEERNMANLDSEGQDASTGGLGLGSTAGLGSREAGSAVEGQQGGGGGQSVAMKMMRSMGWSEGEGLGKERQGIATPIILQKTDKRTGVIVAAEPLARPPPKQGVALSGTPSKVMLLRNMVAPGELDEGIEDEVAEEVSKFGDVMRVLIFEVEGNSVPPEQAVRIFVEMNKVEAVTKAIVGLHGRFFDKKVISATFFDEERFENMDLAPRPEELLQ